MSHSLGQSHAVMFPIAFDLDSIARIWTIVTIVASILLALFVTSTFYTAIYNLYFHPLRHLPGPKLWVAFPFVRHISAMRGSLDQNMRRFHGKYGHVVRYSTQEVSFTDERAWQDIYAYGAGHAHSQLPKNIFLPAPETPNIITANDADHTRFRKALSHGFSEKALRDQEPLMKGYVDLLIEKLKGCAASGQRADMVKWYNLTTFDIIGDLAFGSSFNGLEDGNLHGWVRTIFKGVKLITFIRVAKEYPLLMKLFLLFSPKSLREARVKHMEYSKSTVMKRVNNEALHGRGDFMDAMMKNKGQKDEITDEELIANANILIIAGSETTATLLSGVTYWLLKTPEALEKVTREVREAFSDETKMNFVNCSQKLPYMLHCLDEAHRRYPPVAGGIQRRIPSGPPIGISGVPLPEGTVVSVHQTAAFWSPLNFHEPLKYIPERWSSEAASDPCSPFYNDNRDVLRPFSVGPRNCIGRNLAYNEMRVILARVLWNFDLELCPESEDWVDHKSYMLWEKPELFCRLSVRKF